MKKRPEYVSIGIIARAHGLKGELVVIPISDQIQQFEKLKSISISNQKGKRNSFNIERARVTTNRIIIKLENIDDREAALVLKGLYIDKRSNECEALQSDEYYIFDLIGLKVKTTDDVWLGEIIDVLTLPANDVYVIQNGSNEYLIPAIKDVIIKVDLEQDYILIEPMDGLL
jgi:16S rRNA processing protein RimM